MAAVAAAVKRGREKAAHVAKEAAVVRLEEVVVVQSLETRVGSAGRAMGEMAVAVRAAETEAVATATVAAGVAERAASRPWVEAGQGLAALPTLRHKGWAAPLPAGWLSRPSSQSDPCGG